MGETKPRELWILKTPEGEFVEWDYEPENYDWTVCKKCKFVEANYADALQAELDEARKEIDCIAHAWQNCIDRLKKAESLLKKYKETCPCDPDATNLFLDFNKELDQYFAEVEK